MNSDEIFDALEHISALSGKLDKIAAVTGFIHDKTFERVMVAMYHPLTTYGVRKFERPEKRGTAQFDTDTFNMIGDLANRLLTGNAALLAIKVEMERLTDKSAALLRRIILKDARAGFDAETVNKAKKGLLPEFPYMRCSLPKKVKMASFFDDGAISQVKADGTYVDVSLKGTGEVQFRTRQGNEYPQGAFAEIEEDILVFVQSGTALHGEMLVIEDGKVMPREDGNGVLSHVRSGGDFAENQKPMFVVWDQIPLEASVPKGKYYTPYVERLLGLADQLLEDVTLPADPLKDPIAFDIRLAAKPRTPRLAVIESRWVKDMAEAMVHYRENLARGLEGSVVKKAKAIWKDGTSTEQIKLKLVVPVELRIKGFIEGNGKYAGMLGAFQMESECGQLKVNVNGRGDVQRKEVWENQSKYLEAVATVSGNSIMSPGESSEHHSLFLPVFVEVRDDKSVADSLEAIKAQFEAAISA